MSASSSNQVKKVLQPQDPQEEGRTLSFLSGDLAKVDVAKIERELSRLWESAGKVVGENYVGDEDEHHAAWKPVVRACALNVLMLCDEGGDQREYEDLLAEITLRHPCRAILAVIASAAVEKVEAWVTARCHFLPGRLDKQMCCEQITVKWEGETFKAESLASVVTPLVISQLPSWLFAGSKHLTLADIEPFLAYTDHLLLDSRSDLGDSAACGADLDVASLQSLRSKWQIAIDLTDRAVVVDLAWLTLSAFRKAIALAFDNTDVSIAPTELKNVKEIVIKFGGKSKGLSQAVLLVSWLAARLKLKVEHAAFTDAYAASTNSGEAHLDIDLKGGAGAVKAKLIAVDDACVGVNNFAMAFSSSDTLNVDYVNGALKVTCGANEEYMELPWISRSNHNQDSKQDGQDKFGCGEPAFYELVDKAFEQFRKDALFVDSARVACELLDKIAGVTEK